MAVGHHLEKVEREKQKELLVAQEELE